MCKADEGRGSGCDPSQVVGGEVRIEVGRWRDRLHDVSVRKGNAHGVPDEGSARLVFEEHDVVLGVTRGVHDLDGPPVSERDPVSLLEDEQSVLADRLHGTPEVMHSLVAIDPLR